MKKFVYIHSMTYDSRGLAKELEQLVAVVDEQHIGRAADLLGIPQPTLSRSIARLSQSLGVPLIERDGRGIRVTRHARTLVEHAAPALRDLVAGIEQVRSDCDPESGSVAVGFLPSLTAGLMPELVVRLRRRWPRLRIEVVQDSTDNLLKSVRNRDLDACFAAPAGPTPPDLSSHSIREERLVAVMATQHPFSQQEAVGVAQLLEAPLITMKPGYGLRSFTDELFRAQGLEPSYAFESWDIASAVGLASTGLGVAFLPQGSATRRTTERPITGVDARRDIRMFWPAGSDTLAAQRVRQALPPAEASKA